MIPMDILGPAVTVLIIAAWIALLMWITKNDRN